MISAIVLAAGESIRMGSTNKLLLPLGGRPLIAHVVESIRSSCVHEVVVVTGYEADLLGRVLADHDVRVTHNPDYRNGMATSIQTGIEAACPEASGYMICLSDLPRITTPEFDRLICAFHAALALEERAIVRPTYQGDPGHPVVLASGYREEIMAQKVSTGCRNIVRRSRARVREIAWETNHVVRDVDNPEAYADLAADWASSL